MSEVKFFQVFVLPSRVQHSPQRKEDTVGLVSYSASDLIITKLWSKKMLKRPKVPIHEILVAQY